MDGGIDNGDLDVDIDVNPIGDLDRNSIGDVDIHHIAIDGISVDLPQVTRQSPHTLFWKISLLILAIAVFAAVLMCFNYYRAPNDLVPREADI